MYSNLCIYAITKIKNKTLGAHPPSSLPLLYRVRSGVKLSPMVNARANI